MAFDPKSRSFVLKIQDSGSPSQFNTLGSLIDCDLTITDTNDDITSKGSAGAQELFTEGGIKSYQFSGNLVVTNEDAYADLLTAKLSADPRITAQIIGPSTTFEGEFAIPTLRKSGGNSGRVRCALELASAGAIETSST